MSIIKLRNFINRRTLLMLEGGEGAGSMELINTDVEEAKAYITKIGGNVEEFKAFETNFANAKSWASLGRTQRKDMPVIDDKDVREFQNRLKDGYVEGNDMGGPPRFELLKCVEGFQNSYIRDYISNHILITIICLIVIIVIYIFFL